MPTQQFTNAYVEESSEHDVYVAWDFGYEHVYLGTGARTFQIHDLDELRSSGVHISTEHGELFVYLGATRNGESFQVSINEQALAPRPVDFATTYAPDRSLTLETSTSANLSAPSKTRWKMQERVESGRRWCRVFAAVFALGAFGLSSYTPSKLAALRENGLKFLAVSAGLLLLADLLSRKDNGARFVMLLVVAMVPIAMLGSCFVWLTYGLGLLDPKTMLLPAALIVEGVLGFKAMAARSAGAWLAADDKERRRPKL